MARELPPEVKIDHTRMQLYIPWYINLWWMNWWWNNEPLIFTSCEHIKNEFSVDNRWTEHIVWCNKCGYFYNYCSSD